MSAAEASEQPEASSGQLIVRIARSADRGAFVELFSHFAPRLKAYLTRQGANPAQAEELAQEAMLTVWRKAGYYDPARASAAAWIFTIARNLRLDALRHERSGLAYSLRPADQIDHVTLPDEEVYGAERDARLRDAVRLLPENQLALVQMAFFEDRSHTAIAESLPADSLNRVLARLHDGVPDPDGNAAPLLERLPLRPKRWLAPGMWVRRADLPGSDILYLAFLPSGMRTIPHDHDGLEFTTILEGSFHDGIQRMEAGDFGVLDPDLRHAPTVERGGECLCLVASEKPMRMTSWIGRAMAGLAGI